MPTPHQIPDSPCVSAECDDLLRGLLERDPQCRISFDRFFAHSFIDLDHMPSAHSIHKAVSKRSVYIPLVTNTMHIKIHTYVTYLQHASTGF